MIDIVTSKNIYHDLYKLFVSAQENDTGIMNVHSIDLDKIKDQNLNIVFDYGAIRVQIEITDDPYIKITTTDNVKHIVLSMISEEYPEYIKLVK